MIKRTLPFLIIMHITVCIFGQESSAIGTDQLAQLIQNSFDHVWSELNSDNLDKYYTKDFILLENGEVMSYKDVAAYLDEAIKNTPIPKRVNTIDVIEIKVSEGRAWIAYENSAVFTVDNKIVRQAHWLESATAILTDKGWKLDMLHSTKVMGE